MRLKNWLICFLFVAQIILLSVYFFLENINNYPQSIHAWAQYDRLALADNFIKNKFDIFHPQTYCLNPLYGKTKFLNEYKGITAVDLPIHDFSAALLMHIFHSNNPQVFKLYILTLGLFSIVALAFLINVLQNKISIVILSLPLILLTIPVINFYLPGYLPSIPSMSFTLFAIYFLTRFSITPNQITQLYISNLFFLLSILPRATHTIYLFAAFIFVLWMLYSRKIMFSFKYFIPFVISFSLILTYHLYNSQLREQYGTIFLFWLIPPESILDFFDNETKAFNHWSTHYFTLPHYLLIVASATYVIIKRKALSISQKNLLVFLLISFVGVSIFRVLLNQQFILHDYYFIDTFYILVFVLVAIALSLLKTELKRERYIFLITTLIFGIASTYLCNKKMIERNEYADNDLKTAKTFKSAARIINSLPNEKSIVPLIVYNGSPNAALVHLKRKGFVCISPDSFSLSKANQYPYNLLIVPNDVYNNHLQTKEDWFINDFDSIAGNIWVKILRRKLQ